MNPRELWDRYRKHLCSIGDLGISLDISRMMFDESLFESMAEPIAAALETMTRIEGGEKANVDEARMVGHYWLRAPHLAPQETITSDINESVDAVKAFAESVHTGQLKPQRGDGFFVVLWIGIGGSALGPQMLCDALGGPHDPMIIRFLDNTDPDGIDRVLDELEESLENTLTVVVSKSGGTLETRNAMTETAERYRLAGLDFAKHAVAITCEDSRLDRQAKADGWLRTFPLWDWVGGRTSATSTVGLLPVALLGVDIDGLLSGASKCDQATGDKDILRNPAAMLAVLWYDAIANRDRRNMAVLPYCDRLSLLPRYLQQLVMESVGKQTDRAGDTVHAGITVYGNKGTTDQHALVQQLREGPIDFFATFIGVLKDRSKGSTLIDGATAGDHLQHNLQATRDALYENGRESTTIMLRSVTAESVGAIIALFERTVGIYAELINVNAYHQPGVEAGKCGAVKLMELQAKVLSYLSTNAGGEHTVDQIATALSCPDSIERIYHILEHAAANGDHRVTRTDIDDPFSARYSLDSASP